MMHCSTLGGGRAGPGQVHLDSTQLSIVVLKKFFKMIFMILSGLVGSSQVLQTVFVHL